MASPVPAEAIERLRALPDRGTATSDKLRRGLEALTAGQPLPEDVHREAVGAGGIPAEGIDAPGAFLRERMG